MTGEIWRDVYGYDGKYQVSNFGRVKSFKRNKSHIMTTATNRNGYLTVHLTVCGKSKRVSVHRLVAQAFIPNLLNKPQINHIDGDKTNNRVDNLEWCTNAENQLHATQTGLKKRGAKWWAAKFTNEQVAYIRDNTDKLTRSELAERFGVCTKTISDITTGKRYLDAGGEVKKFRRLPIIPKEIRAEIRRLYKPRDHDFGSRALAKKFGVNHQTILNIIHANN